MVKKCILIIPSPSPQQPVYVYVSADIEEQVIHVILELASPDSLDDYRTEAVAVSISKTETVRFVLNLIPFTCDVFYNFYENRGTSESPQKEKKKRIEQMFQFYLMMLVG